MVGFCERLPLPPNYTQRFADSAACWSVDQVALSLWLRHCVFGLWREEKCSNLPLSSKLNLVERRRRAVCTDGWRRRSAQRRSSQPRSFQPQIARRCIQNELRQIWGTERRNYYHKYPAVGCCQCPQPTYIYTLISKWSPLTRSRGLHSGTETYFPERLFASVSTAFSQHYFLRCQRGAI